MIADKCNKGNKLASEQLKSSVKFNGYAKDMELDFSGTIEDPNYETTYRLLWDNKNRCNLDSSLIQV